jgi:hypothetical protein
MATIAVPPLGTMRVAQGGYVAMRRTGLGSPALRPARLPTLHCYLPTRAMGTRAACCSPRCRSSLCCLARTFPDPFPASRPSCYRCYRLVRRRRCSLSQAQPRRKCHRVPHSLVPAKLHMSLARGQEPPPRMQPSSSMRTMIASCLFPFPHRCRAFAKWTPGRSPAGRDVTPLGGTLQLSQDRNLASATRTRPLKGAPPRDIPVERLSSRS